MVKSVFLSLLGESSMWILAMGKKCAKSALSTSRRILARIFLREDDPAWLFPLKRPARSIRYLQHLARLRRREGRIACDLGSLAKALYRQGLQEEAQRSSKAAFDHWRLSRKAEERIRRAAEDALEQHAR